MRRGIQNALAGLVLLMSITTAGAWVRSYLHDQVHFYAIDGSLVMITIDGTPTEYDYDVNDQGQRQNRDYLTQVASTNYRVLGFQFATGRYKTKSPAFLRDFVIVAIPFYLIMSILALGPIAWIVKHRRGTLRMSRNLCASCGYDLRATPDRCPECGAIPQR